MMNIMFGLFGFEQEDIINKTILSRKNNFSLLDIFIFVETVMVKGKGNILVFNLYKI